MESLMPSLPSAQILQMPIVKRRCPLDSTPIVFLYRESCEVEVTALQAAYRHPEGAEAASKCVREHGGGALAFIS
jgi:hypothetical protein